MFESECLSIVSEDGVNVNVAFQRSKFYFLDSAFVYLCSEKIPKTNKCKLCCNE